MTLPKPTTTEAEREANRRYQKVWRDRHFQLHAEYEKIMDAFRRMPDLLDKLDNPALARKIRRAVKLMEED